MVRRSTTWRRLPVRWRRPGRRSVADPSAVPVGARGGVGDAGGTGYRRPGVGSGWDGRGGRGADGPTAGRHRLVTRPAGPGHPGRWVFRLGEGLHPLGCLRGLAPSVRVDLVRLWGVDLKKGVEIGIGRDLFHATATTAEPPLVVLTRLIDVLDDRGHADGGGSPASPTDTRGSAAGAGHRRARPPYAYSVPPDSRQEAEPAARRDPHPRPALSASSSSPAVQHPTRRPSACAACSPRPSRYGSDRRDEHPDGSRRRDGRPRPRTSALPFGRAGPRRGWSRMTAPSTGSGPTTGPTCSIRHIADTYRPFVVPRARSTPVDLGDMNSHRPRGLRLAARKSTVTSCYLDAPRLPRLPSDDESWRRGGLTS